MDVQDHIDHFFGEARTRGRASVGDARGQASEVTRRIGEAFLEATTLKGDFDAMDEIPTSARKIYDRTLKVMDLLGKAKKEAYQTEMELRRGKF